MKPEVRNTPIPKIEKSCSNCQHYYGRPAMICGYYCSIDSKKDPYFISSVGFNEDKESLKVCDNWTARESDWKCPVWITG